MYRQILVPTDGSPASLRAMEHAAHLVRQADGGLVPMVTVLLVSDPQELRAHVTTPRTPRAERALGLMEKALEKADENLLARAEEILRAQEVPVTTKRLEGTPASEIAAEAEAGGYDLIVMGSRGIGLKGQSLNILGSVTERVLRSVTCPVLVVKETPAI